jgi:hypothetical protein
MSSALGAVDVPMARPGVRPRHENVGPFEEQA